MKFEDLSGVYGYWAVFPRWENENWYIYEERWNQIKYSHGSSTEINSTDNKIYKINDRSYSLGKLTIKSFTFVFSFKSGKGRLVI